MVYKHRLEEEEEEGAKNLDMELEYKNGPPDYVDDEDDKFLPFQKFKYRTNCCYGLSMDLLDKIAQELEFDFRLYIVADGLFGRKTVTKKNTKVSKRDLTKKDFMFKKYNVFYEKVPEVDGDVDVKWNGIVGDIVSGEYLSTPAYPLLDNNSSILYFLTFTCMKSNNIQSNNTYISIDL